MAFLTRVKLSSGPSASAPPRSALYGPLAVALWTLGLVLCASTVTGCAGNASETEYFILDATNEHEPAVAHDEITLRVQRFTVDTEFASKNLVYRLAEFKYQIDPYRQFLIPPGTMIAEQTRQWLSASGLFHVVLPANSRIEPTDTLEASVTALYGDFRDAAAPVAVMEIRFFLVPRSSGLETVAFSRTYRATNRILVRTPEALMEAYNKDLREILTRLQEDLREFLASQTR
jgi:cholesterol transport system auxiliary component